MENELRRLQNYLNRDWQMCALEGYKFNLLEEKIDINVMEEEFDTGDMVDNFILLQIENMDDNRLLENYRTEQVFPTLVENIMGLIGDIYNTDINPKNKLIKSWKTFSARKVKSLGKAVEKNDVDKITEINKELINRYKLVEQYKREIWEHKRIVSLLYRAKDELCGKEEAI